MRLGVYRLDAVRVEHGVGCKSGVGFLDFAADGDEAVGAESV